ncbi:phosphotransferase [Mycolicibacterium palauense]|uniref:phosphotransferase n=1 Tax=Mycolicibacterium palauense TaxID=2034511 RepID=UPI00159B9CD5|nr:phosphotransferase [Mycolicibacterium palauense]
MTAAGLTIPSGIDDLTPAWLTRALRAGGAAPAATVTGVAAERIAEDTGFSALLYRLHLTGTGGVPATVIAKLPGEPAARAAMELLGGYRRELAFYRHVAGVAPLGTARCLAALDADGTEDFVLLLEDLRDWHNADHLAGLSLGQVRSCLGQLAGLHAWSVRAADTAAPGEFPGVDSAVARELFLPAFAPGWQVYLAHRDGPVPASVAGFAERFAELAPTALRALSERPVLLHGDIRADNMFFSGGRLKVVDFQMAVRGAGATDIAYLVSQGLPTEVRRGHDEELVGEYVDLLAAGGVTDYPFDTAWRDYRFAVAYLIHLPVIILNGWDALPGRSRELCLTLTDRAVAAIDDIDAPEVFG